MNIVFWMMVAVLGHMPGRNLMDLEVVRKNYGLAVNDKAICREMINELARDTGSNIDLAYLGGFEAMWAKYVLNPFSKLETFYNGRARIEKAVLEDPGNVEIRFIRLSVQENCPWFLGYHHNVKEDRSFLAVNRCRIVSPALNRMVAAILNDKQ